MWIRFATVVLMSVTFFGCSGRPSAPVSKVPDGLKQDSASGDTPAQGKTDLFGNPVADRVLPTPAMGGGGAAPAPSAPVRTDAFGNPVADRVLPTPAMGGGGAGPAPSNSNNNNLANSNISGSVSGGLANGFYPQGFGGNAMAENVAPMEGGLANGFFPQVATSAPSSAGSQRNLPVPGFGGASSSSGSTAGTNRPGTGRAADDGNLQDAGAEAPQSQYLEEAKALFAKGEENEAVRNLYAYMLSRDESFEQFPLEFYSGLKEPKLFLRIGVGVSYTAPRGFDEKPPVIGDPVADENNRNVPDTSGDIVGASGAGVSQTSNSPYANVDTSTPAGFLLYYTGDYIDRLYSELNSRRKDNPAYFGKILAELPEPVPSRTTPSANENSNFVPGLGGSAGRNLPVAAAGGGGGGGGGASPAGGEATGGGGGADPNEAGSENRGGRRNQRKLLEIWSGGTAERPERLTVGTLIPGVICLGEGKRDDLISRAVSYGVDLVLIFEVRVQEAKGSPYSLTTLNVFDPRQPEQRIAYGRQLKNTTVMETRRGGRGGSGDPVMNEINKVLKDFVDTNFRAGPMPESMKPEHVENRIARITEAEVRDPLPVAVEIVGFYRTGMLADDKAREALNKLFGEKGETLLDGDEASRMEVINEALSRDVFR